MRKPLAVGKHLFEWGRRTYVVGILNVTPDSFSDGGLYHRVDRALFRVEEMVSAGVDLIDVGGESTRPFAKPVPAEEELARVIPVIEAVRKRFDIPISIDTYKARVAREALAAGADIVNDVSALRFDPEMVRVLVETGAPVILMHMKGTPQTMQLDPHYEDVVAEIKDFLQERKEFAISNGVQAEKIILDPGIGFGKRFEDNLAIIKHVDEFSSLGPVLLGPSRKAFLGEILGKEARERDAGTMAVVAYAALKGVDLVRVHNVEMAVDTLKVIQALKEVQ
ncbi:MAG: dihydropteroate synthase [Thermodesulfobacteria bacterium]|nr:dihydropteroate synthase [Thermodesulfobacteriota bacterium]